MNKGAKYPHRISVSLSDKQKKLLSDYAYLSGLTIQEVLRDFIESLECEF